MRLGHNAAKPNIASLLKAEISRVARKEVRAEIEPLKQASAHSRSAIAALRRDIAALDTQLRRLAKAQAAASASAQEAEDSGPQRRFSAVRLAAHRTKLGLSAADCGRLVGASGQSVYNWEQGKSRPRREQLERLASVRKLSPSAAQAALSETSA